MGISLLCWIGQNWKAHISTHTPVKWEQVSMISLVPELTRSDTRKNAGQPLGRHLPGQERGSTQVAQMLFRLLMPVFLCADLLARALMQDGAIWEQYKGSSPAAPGIERFLELINPTKMTWENDLPLGIGSCDRIRKTDDPAYPFLISKLEDSF